MPPRNIKFGLHSVSIWVNVQKKCQVPRLHSIREKCDANFKLSSHLSPKLRPRNIKFGLRRLSIWVNIQKKFEVPGSHSIGEKCVLISMYHRIFLENCATKEHEI